MNGILGILTREQMQHTGNPRRSGCWRAMSRSQWGSHLRNCAATLGVINAISSAFKSSMDIQTPPYFFDKTLRIRIVTQMMVVITTAVILSFLLPVRFIGHLFCYDWFTRIVETSCPGVSDSSSSVVQLKIFASFGRSLALGMVFRVSHRHTVDWSIFNCRASSACVIPACSRFCLIPKVSPHSLINMRIYHWQISHGVVL